MPLFWCRLLALCALLFCAALEIRATATILAATALGPVVSTDGGATWQVLTVNALSPLLTGQPATESVAADPRNPAMWFFTGTTNNAWGLYRTPDSGKTWTVTTLNGFQPRFGPNTLLVDPVTTNVLYMIVGPGSTGNNYIVRSKDSGVTWNPLRLPNEPLFPSGSFPTGAAPVTISTDPRLSGVLFAVAGPYIFKSVDFGTNWALVSAGVDGANFPSLLRVDVDPTSSVILYAAANGNVVNSACTHIAAGGGCAFYKSLDAGATWIPGNLAAPATNSLAIDPIRGVQYAGADVSGAGGSILRSVDGGVNWTPVRAGFTFSPTVRVDPSVPGTVYGFNNIGAAQSSFVKSTDTGTTWSETKLPVLCGVTTPSCGAVDAPVFNDLAIVSAPSSTVLAGTPLITSVVNGAGFQSQIAPNSWVTIFGSEFNLSTGDWSKSVLDGRLPTTLYALSVTIGGKSAYVNFVSPNQLNVLAPDLPPGPTTVSVSREGLASTAVTANVAANSPAFFTWPNNQVVATHQDFTYAAKSGTFPTLATVPAKPGEVIILWGSGFGPTTPATPVGAVTPATQTYAAANPVIVVNSQAATVYGAALAPGFAGLYQIAIQVPPGAVDGDLSVLATSGGGSSPGGVYLTIKH